MVDMGHDIPDYRAIHTDFGVMEDWGKTGR